MVNGAPSGRKKIETSFHCKCNISWFSTPPQLGFCYCFLLHIYLNTVKAAYKRYLAKLTAKLKHESIFFFFLKSDGVREKQSTMRKENFSQVPWHYKHRRCSVRRKAEMTKERRQQEQTVQVRVQCCCPAIQQSLTGLHTADHTV